MAIRAADIIRAYQTPHCTYCGRRTERESGHALTQTRDHILPKSRGGTDDPENIAVACACCNGLKGNMLLEDFLRLYPDGATEDDLFALQDKLDVARKRNGKAKPKILPPEPFVRGPASAAYFSSVVAAQVGHPRYAKSAEHLPTVMEQRMSAKKQAEWAVFREMESEGAFTKENLARSANAPVAVRRGIRAKLEARLKAYRETLSP